VADVTDRLLLFESDTGTTTYHYMVVTYYFIICLPETCVQEGAFGVYRVEIEGWQ
jgi:hypothetical protein